MSLRLRALELHVPDVVARSALQRLFEATASAFGREPVELDAMDRRALLERYVSFTASCAGQTLSDNTSSTSSPAVCGRTHISWASRSAVGSASEPGARPCAPHGSPTG